MKKALLLGAPVAVLGLLLAAVPNYLFPVCPFRAGAMPMRCYQTGLVLTGFGVAFFVIGVLFILCVSSRIRLGLSASAMLLAVAGALVPTHLVGICSAPAMACRIGTYPAAMIVLVLAGLAGCIDFLVIKYSGKEESCEHEAAHNRQYSVEQS